jgi:hypothetical protein
MRLLLDEPRKGSTSGIYDRHPWRYLFLHLEEAPEDLLLRLDQWAAEQPVFFALTFGEELLLWWNRLPLDLDHRRLLLWRSTLFDRHSLTDPLLQERLLLAIARSWSYAPQISRELFDFQSTSGSWENRGYAGGQALFRAAEEPDLLPFALEAARDSDLAVRHKAFGWGGGDTAHRQFTEVLFEAITPGLAAALALKLIEGHRGGDKAWQDEVLALCLEVGGDHSKAALTYASIGSAESAKHLVRLAFQPAASPLAEPELVRTAWIWGHLNSLRARPVLTDDELEQLLHSFAPGEPRQWSLFYVSFQLTALPDRFGHLLEDLAASSPEDDEAISAGAAYRGPDSRGLTLPFAPFLLNVC